MEQQSWGRIREQHCLSPCPCQQPHLQGWSYGTERMVFTLQAADSGSTPGIQYSLPSPSKMISE